MSDTTDAAQRQPGRNEMMRSEDRSAAKREARRRRRQRDRETTGRDSYAEFADRIVNAYGRRVEQGDPTALAALVAYRAKVEQAIERGIQGLLDQGYSWEYIAQHYGTNGTSRQNLMRKYPHLKSSLSRGAQPAERRWWA
jgi:hypothetical protein